MSPRATLFRWMFALAAAACAARGAEVRLSSKSPFAPPGAAGAAAPTANAPLEFVGYYEDKAGRLFRVRDAATKKGVWLRLNERSDEPSLLVKEHDEDQHTLTVEHQGRVLTLAAKEAKIASSGPPMPVGMPPAPLPSNVPAAVTQAVVLNPTPADEKARLDSVAAEVARRRALRVMAEQNVNQPAASSPPAPAGPTPMPAPGSRPR
ncbi:MAG: hypothetical protein ABIQ12_07745 [Opitutaceae bacterium]